MAKKKKFPPGADASRAGQETASVEACRDAGSVMLVARASANSVAPLVALATWRCSPRSFAPHLAIVMDNADSSLNLRRIVPSPRDPDQAAAR
jgi:hypothetical protein